MTLRQIYTDDRRTLRVEGTDLIIDSTTAGQKAIRLDRVEIADKLPANILSAIRQQGYDPKGWYALKSGSQIGAVMPPATRAAVESAMADAKLAAKLAADAAEAEANSPAMRALRTVRSMEDKAESLRDYPGAYFSAKAKAEAARAEWVITYPEAAIALRREALLEQAADLERRARAALDFSADGSLDETARRATYDKLMMQARARREQAGALKG